MANGAPPMFRPEDLAAIAGRAGAPSGGPAGPTMPPMGPPPGTARFGELDEVGQMGMAALDRIGNRGPSGELALERVRRALELAQRLIVASLPMVAQWNAKLSKDLHVIGRQIADARLNLTKEDEPGPPPEALMMGIQGTGLPGGY